MLISTTFYATFYAHLHCSSTACRICWWCILLFQDMLKAFFFCGVDATNKTVGISWILWKREDDQLKDVKRPPWSGSSRAPKIVSFPAKNRPSHCTELYLPLIGTSTFTCSLVEPNNVCSPSMITCQVYILLLIANYCICSSNMFVESGWLRWCLVLHPLLQLGAVRRPWVIHGNPW